MKRLIKNPLFNIAVLFLIGAVVLFTSLNDDFEGIMTTMKNANLLWVYFCFALIIFYYYIGGLLLKVYANIFNKHFTTGQGFAIALIGAFGSGITPAASGGQIFQIQPFKKFGLKVSETASLLWLDFIIYQITMILLVAVLFILKFTNYFSRGGLIFYLIIFGFVANALIMGVLVLLYKSNRFHHWITNKVVYFLHKIRLVKDPNKTIEKISASITRFHESRDLIEKNHGLLFKSVTLNVIRLIVFYAIPYFVAIAMKIDLDPSRIIDIISLTAFVTMVNAFIPIPGASGGTEIVFVSVFSTIIKNGVLSVMLFWRFITFYLIIVVGGLALLIVNRYQSERVVD